MKRLNLKFAVCAGLALSFLMASMPLRAENERREERQEWRKSHPARAKDNARIRNQRRLLRQDLKSGKITKEQFEAQNKELNGIKQEERADARANENGGHLTAGQQKTINSQLNDSRKDINQDVKSDATTH